VCETHGVVQFRVEVGKQRCTRAGAVLGVEHDVFEVVFAGVVDQHGGVVPRTEQQVLGSDDGRRDRNRALALDAEVFVDPGLDAVEQVLGLLMRVSVESASLPAHWRDKMHRWPRVGVVTLCNRADDVRDGVPDRLGLRDRNQHTPRTRCTHCSTRPDWR
jgi:hypothetical protein